MVKYHKEMSEIRLHLGRHLLGWVWTETLNQDHKHEKITNLLDQIRLKTRQKRCINTTTMKR